MEICVKALFDVAFFYCAKSEKFSILLRDGSGWENKVEFSFSYFFWLCCSLCNGKLLAAFIWLLKWESFLNDDDGGWKLI